MQNRYKVESLISASGAGQVYKASDVRFPGKWWALKVFHGARAELFDKEAKALTLLNHPHLVKIVDYFSEKEKFYLVMEYVNGRSLDRILEESAVALSERQVLSWGIQCADALLFLHSQFREEYYYRNFSPRKILITASSEVKLVPEMPGALRRAGVQGVMGFAAPEVFDERGELNEQSNLYALAAVLNRCLVGESATSVPFVFVPVRTVNSRIISEVEKVLEKATQSDPHRRYFGMQEFRKELYHCFQDVLRIHPPPIRSTGGGGVWWLLMALSGMSILAWLYFVL